jgi:2-amino-4-hydroxy-6-hydroxymethyldihydropteridine diphosphokinase
MMQMDSSNKEPLIVLGLGSNNGDSRLILKDAIAALSAKIRQLRSASVYKTAPMYVLDQPDFFNTAVSGYFDGSAFELLAFVNEIEADFGRNRSLEQRFGMRTLDIDILLFGDEIINQPPKLIIPHERLKERAFALVPLLELLPEAVDSKTGISYKKILSSLPNQGIFLDNDMKLLL